MCIGSWFQFLGPATAIEQVPKCVTEEHITGSPWVMDRSLCLLPMEREGNIGGTDREPIWFSTGHRWREGMGCYLGSSGSSSGSSSLLLLCRAAVQIWFLPRTRLDATAWYVAGAAVQVACCVCVKFVLSLELLFT